MRTTPYDGPEPKSVPELIQAARAGSSQALGSLCEHASPYLHLLAEHNWPARFRRYQDPADLVSETFAEVCRVFPSFRGNSEPEWVEWLRQALRHKLVSVRRRLLAQKRQADRAISLDHMPPGEEIAREWLLNLSTPGTRAVRAEMIAQLADALNRLSPEQYQVVWLRYYEGCTYAEIGEALGRSEEAVRKFWCRILDKLRKFLGGTDAPPT